MIGKNFVKFTGIDFCKSVIIDYYNYYYYYYNYYYTYYACVYVFMLMNVYVCVFLLCVFIFDQLLLEILIHSIFFNVGVELCQLEFFFFFQLKNKFFSNFHLVLFTFNKLQPVLPGSLQTNILFLVCFDNKILAYELFSPPEAFLTSSNLYANSFILFFLSEFLRWEIINAIYWWTCFGCNYSHISTGLLQMSTVVSTKYESESKV